MNSEQRGSFSHFQASKNSMCLSFSPVTSPLRLGTVL